VFPIAIEQVSSHAGHLIAIPVSIRGENWLFYNVELLRKAGLQVPRTWPEFLATAAALKARGTTPLALGGQPWQERLLFNAVLLGVGGRDFYRQVYEHLNNEAIDSRVMLTVFETYGALRAFVDEGSPGRRWSQTTLMLVRGEAAFQVMGDWAKGEIVAAGLEPGKEIGCALAPASEASYIMMIDAFVFSRTHDESVRAGQALFARTIQEPAIQATLAQRLGAIPARIDLPATGLDVCSAHALSVVQDPRAQLLDPALSLAGGLAGAIDDSLSRFWNDRGMSAARGHALFREAVRRYR
jgi:glucose/mannose transport system substrate-binding protein